MRRAIVLVGVLLLLPAWVAAQQPDPAEKTREERLAALEERMRTLEAELRELKAARAPMGPGQAVAAKLLLASTPAPDALADPASGPAQTQGGTSAQLPVYGGATGASKALNPDISVIGNFWGAIGRNTVRPVPALEFHEAEIAFQAIVDPFARADFFLSLGREGVELEEGYLTFSSLPAGFVARVGKMRAAFGKANAMHNDALSWIDRPLMAENLVAGEDGINDAGLSVTRILPAPKGLFLEGTAQVFRGDSGDVFTASRRQDVSYVGHLRGYKDLTESTNVDLGFSYARGHNDVGNSFITQLYGMDATLRWKPLRRAIYHNLVARTELVWSRREQLPALQRAFGFYASVDFRVNRRWTVGGRYDRSGRARQADLTDSGFSALLTYWPSEFSQVRAQYRFARYAEGRDANELRFQFLFVLGAHGAHPF